MYYVTNYQVKFHIIQEGKGHRTGNYAGTQKLLKRCLNTLGTCIKS